MDRVLILDAPRGPLGKLAAELELEGVAAVREPGPSGSAFWKGLGAGDFLGAIVHCRRSREIARLRAGLAEAPVLIWYPARTSAKELAGWARSGARDFIVGEPAAAELVFRLRGLAASKPAGVPWLEKAMDGLRIIIRAVNAGEDDFAILSSTSRELERLFPGAQCAIMTISARGDSGLVITQGDHPEPLDIPLEVSRYPEIQKMLTTKKTVAVRDVRKHPLMKEVRSLLLAKDLISILAVPIIYRDEVIGLIMLRTLGRPRTFSPIEISFCENVAHTAAAALRGVRLGREMAEEMRKSREARKLAKKKTTDLARMEAIIERASDGIVVVDEQGMVRGVNVNFTRLTGLEKEDVEGRDLDEVMTPGPGETASLRRALQTKKHAHSRGYQELVCKDGSVRQVAARIEPMPQRKEWLISIHDVTEERALAEALRHTRDFLQKVIQSSMDAIIAADMKGSIILFNQAAESISGYRSDEVVGKMNIVNFYAGGVARDIMRKLRSGDYGGKGKLESCYNTIISKTGEEVPINMSASLIFEDGREIASVGIFQDLRERIKIEKELRQAQEMLMSSQQKEAIMALSGAASHELNQPLTSILGYAELLKRVERNLAQEVPSHPAVASLRNAAEIISQEADRMAEVVRKIGEVSEYKTVQYVGGARIMDLERARGSTLDKNQAAWQAMFTNSKEAMIVFGDDTIIRMANPAAVVISGENPIGKSFTRYLRDVDYTRAMEAFERGKAGENIELEVELVIPGGRPVRILAHGSRVPEQDEFFVIYTDVTGSRRVEEELKELHAFHDRMLKNTSLPMIALDVDGKITFFNLAAEKLLGYSAEQVRGKAPDFLIHKFSPDLFRETLRRVRREGDLAEEIKVVTSSGERVKVYQIGTAMRDEDGQTIGFLSMLFDLSRQYQFERELKDKTGQIALMNQMVEALRGKVGLEQALGEILQQLARLFPLDLAAIVLNEENARELYIISFDKEREKVSKNTLRLYEDADAVRKLLFLEKPAIYDDLSMLDLDFTSGDIVREMDALQFKGLKSVMTYPLIFQGAVLGTLHLISRTASRYSPRELERLAEVSGPLIMALANARLFNQIERQNLALSKRNRWMEQLIRAGQKITMDMQPEQIIAALVKSYLDAHPRQHFSVWLEAPGTGELALVTQLNYEPDQMPPKLVIPPAILHRLRREGEAVDLQLAEDNDEYQPILPDARSIFIAPLIAPDQWLGLIVLESHHLAAFDEEEKVEVQVLAANIAGALRNLLVCFALDISLRFRQGLMEDANALILVLDRSGNITLVNRSLQELLEIPQSRFLGLHFREFFKQHLRIFSEADSDAPMTAEEYRSLIVKVQKGEKFANLRTAIISASGKQHLVIFNTSSILDRNGDFQGFIAIGQNITRHKQLEGHLLHAEKLATIGQMAASIAHELNNPLTGIISAADMLARVRPDDDKSRSYLEQLQEEARRIETLVQNLMSYARPSREEMFPLNLGRLISDSLSFSRYELARNQSAVEVKVPDDLPPIRGIKDQLQQVFINLLTNAAHAVAEKGGGKITIRAKTVKNKMVEIKVCDNGIGIPEQDIPRLFEPFFTTKPEGKGTGLGLSIVKDIINRHAGSIAVESKPGEGAAFSITLPIYANNHN